MINSTMFKEWCNEMHNKSKQSVLREFALMLRWNGYCIKDLPDIEERVKYIKVNYPNANRKLRSTNALYNM